MKPLLVLCATVFLCGCHSLPYKADIGFLNSAQANSMEYPVTVGGVLCKDMAGLPGLCTTRIDSDKALRFHQDAMPYAYKLVMVCSSTIDSNSSWSVPKNQAFDWEIKPEKFSSVRSFTCTGEVFPDDRLNKISATWSVRAVVVDPAYKERESIHYLNGHLVLGTHAKYSIVCDHKCKRYRKRTIVKTSPTARAYSESELMRFNYYGFGK